MIHGSTFVDQLMLNIVATCWNVVATCWILIQLLLSNNNIWNEVEMADEEMLLSLCASSVVVVIMKRRQKRRKNRKIWTREWLRNRTIFGAYYTLLAELRNLDISSYRNFLRMDVTSFEELLHLVAPIITRQETNMRSKNSIRTRTQLIPTLRPPCWYCHETTWHQTRKTIGLSRQLVERNRAKFYFRSTTFNNFQHVERQIPTFNISWYTVNICWTATTTFVAQQMLNRVSLALHQNKLHYIDQHLSDRLSKCVGL